MTRKERNKDYRENFEEYVNVLMKFPDALLEKKLDLVQLQIGLAIKNKDEEVYETLSLWERHIIEARILKSEQEVEEPYIDEMALAIADIEHIIVKSSGRKETAEEETPYPNTRRPKIKEDDSGQTSLF